MQQQQVDHRRVAWSVNVMPSKFEADAEGELGNSVVSKWKKQEQNVIFIALVHLEVNSEHSAAEVVSEWSLTLFL